jgi:UDP-N-acetylglucosamine transferase subunit ALG13
LIVAALGTHEQPFERVLDLLEGIELDEELVIQHGHTESRSSLEARWHRFLGYEEVIALFEEASAVISHAGIGTLLTALGAGKVPIAVPRLRRLREHIDDHQLQIVEAFGARGYVIPCLEGDDLSDLLQEARSREPLVRNASGELPHVVAEATRVAPKRSYLQRALRARA